MIALNAATTSIPFEEKQTLTQLYAQGFSDGSRFYGRVLLPRELQESAELRASLGCQFKTIDFFCDLRGDRLVVTRLKWVQDADSSPKPDGTQKFKLVPGETYQDGYQVLRRWNQWGGVYFYPNPGGRFNRDITACPSGYFESDSGTFEQQWAAIEDFGEKTGILPTCIVKTRKSLHVYYKFIESEQQVLGWTEEIQRPLCLAMRSDPAVQNTARLMRLAGFNHVKWIAAENRLDFVPVTLEVCEPQRQYTRAQLRAAINTVLPQTYSLERFKFWVYFNSPAHKDLDINIDSEIARTCSESNLEETERRWRRFIKLCRDKANGKDCNPDEAFNCDLKTLPQVHCHKFDNGEIFEGDRNTITWAKYLYGYNPIGRGGWITAQDPLIPESERHLHSIDSLHIHKVTGAIKSHRGSDAKDIYDRMREIAEEGTYRELTGLTAKPWKEINTPKLDLEALDLEPGAIYIVRSAKGTHKTNSLVALTPKFRNIYSWFSRIALGREECARIGLNWKDDLKSWTGHLKVGFCGDSAFSFNPGLLQNNGLLLCDEADQVFEHLFGDTCNKGGKRPLILAALQAQINAVLAGNGMALFLSADIADKEVTYIKQLAPDGCPVRLIINHYNPARGDVYFHESDTPDGVIEQMLQDLEDGKPCFVIDDMKNGVRGCKSIADYIRCAHPEWADEIVEINSDTSGDPAIIDYLRNINEASKTTRLLCCSPSVTSGVSIENGHFQGVYAFLNGVLTTGNASQAIARVRGAKLINIWVAEKGLVYAADHSLFPEQIKAYYKRNYEANCKHILAFNAQYEPLNDEWTSPHFDLFCKNAAYRNNCMVQLRERLRERLIDEGYNVIAVAALESDIVAEGLKESWSRIEINHARAVAAANILSSEQLQALEENPKALTPEQKLDVEKTYLLKTYGQELIDSMIYKHRSGEVLTDWAAMVLKDNKGEYRRQLEAFYLLTCGAEVAIAKDLKAEQRQIEHKAGRFAGDVRWFTRQRKAREFLGLDKFLDPEVWWDPTTFADLTHKAKKHFGRVKDALGFAARNMTGGQIFSELLRQLGLDLEKKWAAGQSTSGHRYKLRRIDSDSWHYAQLYVKHRQPLTQDSSPPELVISDHPSGSNYSKQPRGGDQTLTITQHTVEPCSNTDFGAKEKGEKRTCQSIEKIACSHCVDSPSSKNGELPPPTTKSPPQEMLEGLLTLFEVYGQHLWRQVWDATSASTQAKILQTLMFTLGAGELRSLASALEVST
jgi:hypothetical protein